MKGFIVVFSLAVGALFAPPASAQTVQSIFCENCRGLEHPQDFVNAGVNHFVGPNDLFDLTLVNEVVVVNSLDVPVYVLIEVAQLPFLDAWDETEDTNTMVNTRLEVTTVDLSGTSYEYWIDFLILQDFVPLPVGAPPFNSGPDPVGSDSGGGGGGEGSGGSGGAGAGSGSGSSGGGGGGGGGAGCSVSHTATETILTCYVN